MKKIGIISHDAGGAEILSSWVKDNYNKYDFIFFLDGPAKSIFEKNLKTNNINKDNLCTNEFINLCDFLICGTSWQSNLEKNFIKACKLKKKKIISILDHWYNYRERFILDGEIILPNEIWVTNNYAFEIAHRVFKDLEVKQIEDYYSNILKKKIKKYSKKNLLKETQKILYVCEPIREHAELQYGDENYHGYTEESAVRYFLENLSLLDMTIKKILIRPHPSEQIIKYNWLLNEFKYLNIKISSENELIKDILSSDAVVGCESMALVVGLLAKKRVISSIPPEGRECVLPHQSIEKLKDIKL